MASPEELRIMTRVARMYHTEGVRQPQIAQRLGLSQARVSRLLHKAERHGIVRITVSAPAGTHPDLEGALQERYGLKLALVVEAAEDEEQHLLPELGAAAAYYLEATLRSGDVIGISSWSASLLALVDHLQPVPGLSGVRVVQVLGGVGDPAAAEHANRLTDRMARVLHGSPVHLPSPGVAGSAASARALREDPFVAAGIGLFDSITVALVGIGSLEPSRVLASSGNVFSAAELAGLRAAGAVGDVCLRFFDAHGAPVDAGTADRVIGISPGRLRAVPRSVAVAGGRRKTEAVRGALRGGLVNVLITDRFTAGRLLTP
ncbi:sugar-binding transcriptional regulator [Streptomyces hoynatensis]|uniref:Sugar-binding transcriptional regulator n=1 Tax=Streptomyces hoynatensis TaxID=1141874 RepID=A0A3A9ZAX6_9ACTN|nr:sugar-binding transcriptional regulator [Streptomyces hoynatensis]RKN44954.1 sugar-binding transcriptional regulator [Streptomyces hoynatensis]